jgi:hypothetical protein
VSGKGLSHAGAMLFSHFHVLFAYSQGEFTQIVPIRK